MTGLVDRTTRAGLVERRPDPRDGRAMLLHLTDKGVAARDAAKGSLETINQHLTEGFTPDELNVVSRWLSALSQKFPRGEGS